MTIDQAIAQLKNAIQTYITTDENGCPLIPVSSQRPIFLYGPPGIGKTAIVRAVANDLNIGFLSYTMTHHTRQSALGLPRVIRRSFKDVDCEVTEYTMSEIMLDVYEANERTGVHSGVLFLDEINCVSETLMPAMLELLQFKRFGKYSLPSNWVIVCAGNPEEYNRSAHAFDSVILDRVRMIRIEPDFDSWMKHAIIRDIEPSILSYLQTRHEHFCVYSDEGAVTPRSWMELSAAMKAMDTLSLEMDQLLFEQYIQIPDICESFSLYFRICKDSKSHFDLADVMNGKTDIASSRFNLLEYAERVYIIQLLSGMLIDICSEYRNALVMAEKIKPFLNRLLSENRSDAAKLCKDRLDSMVAALQIRIDAGAISPVDIEREQLFHRIIRSAISTDDPFTGLDHELSEQNKRSELQKETVLQKVGNILRFVNNSINDSGLRVIFTTAVSNSSEAMCFLRPLHSSDWEKLHESIDMRKRMENIRSRFVSG